MAHKKRKDETSTEIELPEFDEVEFMQKDVEGTKAAIGAILYAVPAALVAFGITVALAAPVVALGAGLFFLVTLRRVLPLLRIQTAGFKLRDWLGHSSTFFFSFLAFWILLMNPPFGDFTPPDFRAVHVNGTAVSGGVVQISVSNLTNWTNVLIAVDVGDNVALREVTLTVPGFVNGTAMVRNGAAHSITVNLNLGPPQDRSACITATDTAGLRTSYCFTILRRT